MTKFKGLGLLKAKKVLFITVAIISGIIALACTTGMIACAVSNYQAPIENTMLQGLQFRALIPVFYLLMVIAAVKVEKFSTQIARPV